MALTINSSYASGTVSSALGTTITLATGVAVADWVGRLFVLNRSIAGRGGQYREIVAVNSASSIEIDYPWRTSLDSSDPDYEQLPQSGDAFHISHGWDDIDNGIDVIKVDANLYRLGGILDLSGNITIYAKNLTIDLADANRLRCSSSNSGYIFGAYNDKGRGESGCFLLANIPSASTTNVLENGDTGVDGDIIFCACNIKVPPSGNTYFLRGYRGANHICRIVDCLIDGNFSGRYQGTRSKIVRNMFVNGTGTSTPFTTKAPVGLIAENTVINSAQVLYWHFDFSGSGTVDGIVAEGIAGAFLRTRVASGASNHTVSIKNVVFNFDSANLLLVDNSAGSGNRLKLIYTLSLSALSGMSLSGGGKAVFYDNAGTEVYNQVSADGIYSDADLVWREYLLTTTGSIPLSSSTLKAPYIGRFREYGQQFLEQAFSAESKQSFTWFKQPDENITAGSKAIVDAYTGFGFGAESLTISEDRTNAEIYDRCRSYLVDNMDVAEFVSYSKIANRLLFEWDLTLNSTLSGDGIIQFDGAVLTLNVGGQFARPVEIGSAQKIVITADCDLSTWTFADGAALEVVNGATVAVTVANTAVAAQLNADKIETSGSISLVAPQTAFTAPNLPDGAHYLLRYSDGDEAELEIGTISGGSGLSYTLPPADNRLIRLLAIHVTSTPLYASRLLNFVFRNTGVSVATEAGLEEFTLYAELGRDGLDPVITSKFVLDNPNLQIDANDVDGILSATEAHAFAWGQMQLNPAALRLGYVPIEAFTRVGYVVRSNWKVENQSLTTPLLITDGYYIDEAGQPYNPCAPAVDGKQSTSVQFEPSHTVSISGSGGGGLGPEDAARLERIENQLMADYFKGENRYQKFLSGTSTVIYDKDVQLAEDGFRVTQHEE